MYEFKCPLCHKDMELEAHLDLPEGEVSDNKGGYYSVQWFYRCEDKVDCNVQVVVYD